MVGKVEDSWVDKKALSSVRDGGGCGCSGKKETVIIEDKALIQIKTLCREVPTTEWIAVLIGERSEQDYKTVLKEIKIFEQEVNGQHCEFTDKGSVDAAMIKSVGWIHSHNNMDAFFSGMDVDTAKGSQLSLCVNNAGAFYGKSKRRLPCGDESLIDVEIRRSSEYEEDAGIIEDAKRLIKNQYSVQGKLDYETPNSQNNINDDCLVCFRKVGRNKRKYVTQGVVHKTCNDEYLRLYDRDRWVANNKEDIEESCVICGYEVDNCQCICMRCGSIRSACTHADDYD